MVLERVVYIASGSFAADILLNAARDGSTIFIAASHSLSMATNAVATALIAYRTWLVSSYCYRYISDCELGSSVRLYGMFSLIREAKSAAS
jgi:hypothetical protein